MQDISKAVKLLGAYTAGRFDIWLLAGSSKASCRAHVMSVLIGHKVPQSKAGINAMRAAFYSAGNIQGEYEAMREENFLAWAKAVQSVHSICLCGAPSLNGVCSVAGCVASLELESDLEWLRRTGAH